MTTKLVHFSSDFRSIISVRGKVVVKLACRQFETKQARARLLITELRLQAPLLQSSALLHSVVEFSSVHFVSRRWTKLPPERLNFARGFRSLGRLFPAPGSFCLARSPIVIVPEGFGEFGATLVVGGNSKVPFERFWSWHCAHFPPALTELLLQQLIDLSYSLRLSENCRVGSALFFPLLVCAAWPVWITPRGDNPLDFASHFVIAIDFLSNSAVFCSSYCNEDSSVSQHRSRTFVVRLRRKSRGENA